MNEGRVSGTGKLKELTQLLLHLFETARRLPDGPAQQAAFREIKDFQRRLARLIANTPRPG
jgi:hypothetical protein